MAVKRKASVTAQTILAQYEPVTIWEHDGITYQRRDVISISGETGEFRFWEIQKGQNDREVVTCWWVNRGFRSFTADRVKQPKRRAVPKERKKKEKVAGLCDTHPAYGAIRKPRTDCTGCWSAYNSRKDESNGEV